MARSRLDRQWRINALLLGFASLVLVIGTTCLVVTGCSSGAAAGQRQRPHHAASGTGTWRRLPVAPFASPAAGGTSVWTGSEMIVAGVRPGRDGTFIDSTEEAAAYDPASRTWRTLARPPETGSICPRSAVWTGKRMLVWGCGLTAFDPLTGSWQRLASAPASHGIAVWTGTELIGWGGGCCGDAWSGGSAYNPPTNTWRKLAPSPLAPEQGPLGAWTGHELVLFVSGINPASGKPYPARFARAAAYDPATDTWHRIAPLPEPRQGATAVWDGRELLVVGGNAVGFAYNPATNRWRRLPAMEDARVGASAVWTGRRLLLWGGETGRPDSPVIPSRGLAYDPRANRWSRLPKAPLPDRQSTVVWTGHALIVWGGVIGTPPGTTHAGDYPKYLTDGAVFIP